MTLLLLSWKTHVPSWLLAPTDTFPATTSSCNICNNVLSDENSWLCTECLSLALPYAHIENNEVFKSILSESSTNASNDLTIDINELNARFHIENPESSNCPIFDDIDPDSNYYNNAPHQCNYHNEISLNNTLTNTSTLNILNHNIRSAPKNLDNLLYNLKSYKIEFTVIGLTETWCNESNVQITNIPGYCHSHQIRKHKSHGGLSIFVKNNIHYLERKDLYHLSLSLECIFIEIPNKGSNGEKNIIIGLIYRPPSGDKKLFFESIEPILNTVKNEQKECFILGDFNINLLSSDTHKNNFESLMLSYSYFPLINKPTRITKHSATLIDNIFTNHPCNGNNPCLNGILINDVTDHFPVFTSTDITVQSSPQQLTMKRKYTPNNINAFKEMLEGHNWDLILSEQDCQTAYNNFLIDIKTFYDNAFPLTKCSAYHVRKDGFQMT